MRLARTPRALAPIALLVALASGAAQAQPDAQAPSGTPGALGAPSARAGRGGGAPVTALQGALLADPESRDGVLALEEDPLVREILRDEATMRAIESGDLEQLLGDPRLRALAEHPTVKEIIERQSR